MKVTYHDPCHAGRHLTKYLVDKDGSQLWAGAYISLNEEDCLYDIPRELSRPFPASSWWRWNGSGPIPFAAAAAAGS